MNSAILWLPVFFLVLTACGQEPPPSPDRPVRTIRILDTPTPADTIVFPGTLRAYKRADLAFRVDGIVVMRDIYVGYKAQKDEVLSQLDPREYELALKKAKGKLESVQAQADFARRDFERMKKIFERDSGAISESLLDRKRENSHQLNAELVVAEGDYEQAADDLSYTSLRAPFDGIVAAIYVQNHEQVRAKQPVIRLLDTTDREMEINVPEKYINALLEGGDQLRFEVQLDAYPNALLPAYIKEIGTEAASTTQTFPVTIGLQGGPPNTTLLAGMTGKALISHSRVDDIEQGYTVPRSAIFTEDGRITYVWVVDERTQTVHRRAVEVDTARRSDSIMIRKGVSPNETIVTAGTSFLKEGQRVRLEPEPSQR